MTDANDQPEVFLECPRCRRPASPGRWEYYPSRGGPIVFKCSFCSVGLTIPRRAWGWGVAAGLGSFVVVLLPCLLADSEANWQAWVFLCLLGIALDGFVGSHVAKRLTDHLVALQD